MIRNGIPNIISFSSVVFSSLCVIFFWRYINHTGECFHLYTSVFLFIMANIADGMDGFAARKMKLESKFGMQLDSMCDVVSFGCVPAIVFSIYTNNVMQNLNYIYFSFGISIIIVISAIFRLVRFNINKESGFLDAKYGKYCQGLPAPFFASLIMAPVFLLSLEYQDYSKNKIHFLTLCLYQIVICIFAISSIKIPSINVFKKYQIKIFIFILILMLLVLQNIVQFFVVTIFISFVVSIIKSLFRTGIKQ
jgi:CDP-diacylglycerol--serine O-phosphatidyltransferase